MIVWEVVKQPAGVQELIQAPTMAEMMIYLDDRGFDPVDVTAPMESTDWIKKIGGGMWYEARPAKIKRV